MTDPKTDVLPLLPTSDEFANYRQRRLYLFLALAVGLSLASTVAYVYTGMNSLIFSAGLVGLFAAIVAIWRFPIVTFYFLFAGTLLFELTPIVARDAILERVPLFWNLNTLGGVYTHSTVEIMPLNLMEVLLLITGVIVIVKAAFNRHGKITWGPLLWPIAVYMGFVALGWINGMLNEGDFKVSLQEVRSQFYFLLAYLLVVNALRTPRQMQGLLWITVLCIGLKGFIYLFRRYTLYAGLPLPDGGVGSHEEAFFFDCFVMLLLVLSFCGIQKHVRAVMWLLLPFVVLGELATNRRAGTAAFIVALPALLLLAHRALPKRRMAITAFSIMVVILFPIYYYSFKDNYGMLGQPARAISSQFDPDPRDASSNEYRDAENADLMATIRLSPLQGYGYGRRMLHAVPIADISSLYEWWDVMTHNQVLWVWMRVGTFGMLSFWMMLSAIIIKACRSIRSETANIETKAVCMFVLLVIFMLTFFGLYDLQFSNYRDMLFGGFCAGILAMAPQVLSAPSPRNETASNETTS